jgi:ATP-dependent DNA helicase RecG
MDNHVQHIFNLGENASNEFKTSFNDELIISLVAFSNTSGGAVYVGIEDDDTIKGVSLRKETIAQWINEIKNKTVPAIFPDVEVVEIDKRQVAIFKIQ